MLTVLSFQFFYWGGGIRLIWGQRTFASAFDKWYIWMNILDLPFCRRVTSELHDMFYMRHSNVGHINI